MQNKQTIGMRKDACGYRNFKSAHRCASCKWIRILDNVTDICYKHDFQTHTDAGCDEYEELSHTPKG